MALEAALKAAQAAVPGCVFAGLVDLEQGLPLGRAPGGGLRPDEAEHLAALAAAYLSGPEAGAVAAAAGGAADGYDEVVAVAAGRVAVIQRLPCRPGAALCLVCDGAAAPSEVAEAARGQLAALDRAEWPA